jgi:hypothetical protein
MIVKYDEIEITYIESENKWRCEIRGRERNFESLAKAKEAIDRPAPEEKTPFTRVEVLMRRRYGDATYKRATLTSEAEVGRYGRGRHYWGIVDGSREKIEADLLFLCNAPNLKRIEKLAELQKKIDALEHEQQEINNSMDKWSEN